MNKMSRLHFPPHHGIVEANAKEENVKIIIALFKIIKLVLMAFVWVIIFMMAFFRIKK